MPDMTSTALVTTARFRAQLSEYLERANRQPITIASRGARARGVLVSREFFERACIALGDEPYASPPQSRLDEIMEDAMRLIGDL